MKRIISALVILTVTHSWIQAEEDSIVVARETGVKKIDVLVAQLVSRNPPPLPGGALTEEYSQYRQQLMAGLKNDIWATESVRDAMKKLIAEGPPAFYYLVQHLGDDRYSYSAFPPSEPPYFIWHNRKVNEALIDVLANGLNRMEIYHSRISPKGPTQFPPTFKHFMETEGSPMQWAQKYARKSRLQVDLAFIDWCIDQEKSWGFKTPEEEKEILGKYNKKRKELEQASTGQPATRPESKSEGNEKPQPESEGRSR
jgi:hypothetical protein